MMSKLALATAGRSMKLRLLCAGVLGLMSCSAIRVVQAGNEQPGQKQLPRGFVAVPGTGVHESGWALEIRCLKDDAIMVFVPGGKFCSGLDEPRLRRLAELMMELHPREKDKTTAEMEMEIKRLAFADAEVNGKRLFSQEDIETHTVGQLLAIALVAELQAGDQRVPDSVLGPWKASGKSLESLLSILEVRDLVGEARAKELLKQLQDYEQTLSRVADPNERDPVNALLDSLAGNLKPASVQYLAPFYIDKYEVTNGHYRRFATEVNIERYLPRIIVRGYGLNILETEPVRVYELWEDNDRNGDNQPVTCVSAEDAVAYAAWAGKMLPTREQWERAAVGDGDRLFPWGSDFGPGYCFSKVLSTAELGSLKQAGGRPSITQAWRILRQFRKVWGVAVPAAVGSYPKDRSPYSCHDMGGNVSEWVRLDADTYCLMGGNANSISLDDLVAARHRVHVDSPKLHGFRTVLLLDNARYSGHR